MAQITNKTNTKRRSDMKLLNRLLNCHLTGLHCAVQCTGRALDTQVRVQSDVLGNPMLESLEPGSNRMR
jgi:hypothetical protein